MDPTHPRVCAPRIRGVLAAVGFALGVILIDPAIARAGEPGGGEAGSWQAAQELQGARPAGASTAVPAAAPRAKDWHDKAEAEWRDYHRRLAALQIANAGR